MPRQGWREKKLLKNTTLSGIHSAFSNTYQWIFWIFLRRRSIFIIIYQKKNISFLIESEKCTKNKMENTLFDSWNRFQFAINKNKLSWNWQHIVNHSRILLNFFSSSIGCFLSAVFIETLSFLSLPGLSTLTICTDVANKLKWMLNQKSNCRKRKRKNRVWW